MTHDAFTSRPDEEFTEERRKEFSPGSKLMLSLGKLEKGMEMVLGQLTEITGAQKALVERMGKVELFDETHPLKCPMKEEILNLKGAFEKHLVATETEKKANTTWWENLKPIVLILSGGLLVLLAKHFDQWWK